MVDWNQLASPLKAPGELYLFEDALYNKIFDTTIILEENHRIRKDIDFQNTITAISQNRLNHSVKESIKNITVSRLEVTFYRFPT